MKMRKLGNSGLEVSALGMGAMNLSFGTGKAVDDEIGRWKAIENREIFRMQRELDMVYKSELALGLSEAGYQLRATKNGFELAQIDDRLIAEFSKRKEVIDQALRSLLQGNQNRPGVDWFLE